jgi:hypothetical protein
VKLHFEFLTVFRQKMGRESLTVRLADRPGRRPTVLEALEALESSVANKGLRLLDGARVAGGVLIFRRSSTGALERIRDPENESMEPGENLVLSVAMEGG